MVYIYNILANSHLRRDFPRPPGEWRRRRHLWVPAARIWETAAFGGGEREKKKQRKKKFEAPWAPDIWGAGGPLVGASV